MSFKYPGVTVSRINLKPLLPKAGLSRIDTKSALKSLQQSVLRRIRDKILQEAFSVKAKRALYSGLSVKVGQNSITVIAKHPAFRPLLEGQREGQMRWLTKAARPIPIVTEEGKLIFRNATPRSMLNGSWYHPGRKPTKVLEKAKEEAREVLRKKLRESIRNQVRSGLRFRK